MKILVTAGPTREPIDPVRYISNRSSGRMGYAVAEAALQRGHEVALISGPAAISPPAGVRLVLVTTAREMLEAVEGHLEWADALVMSAAVADWRPVRPRRLKIKKNGALPLIRLTRTVDILSAVAGRKGDRIMVGFAAETGSRHLAREAERKRREKNLDLVVANDVTAPGAGFEVETNQVLFVTAEGVEQLPLMSKREVGQRIVRWIEGFSARR